MSKPWGNKIGAWAAETEAAEAEELASLASPSVPPATFPSLREAASVPKQKKKPVKKLSLHEFTNSASLTPAEMLRLPTGPKTRSEEEIHSSRGFLGYSGRSREDRDGGERRSYGSGTSRGSEFDNLMSRADETDNWASGKKSLAGFESGRGNRYDLGSGSRADESDSWGVGKKVQSFESGRGNRYDLGSGSRADESDSWGTGKKIQSFESGRVNNYDLGSGSRADGADNWGVGKKFQSFDSGRGNKYENLGSGSRADGADNWGVGKRVLGPEISGFGSGFREMGSRELGLGGLERKRLVLDPPKKDIGVGGAVGGAERTNKASPFGVARPREEVLAEKGLDWKKMEMDIEAKKTSRPTSSHSSRPNSSQSNRSESVGVGGEVGVKSRPKVNPFGDAKPREVLLQEKGLDWRKIDLDLDHRRVDRPETDEEKILKEEIDQLKKEFAKQSASDATRDPHEGAADDLPAMITSKEKDLELLIRELDDKIRFLPRVNERPGSGAGRVSGPHSRSESFDEYRNAEFTERPRSRGTVDMGSRQSDDRRSFQGGMERGFMDNRGMNRPRSRERW